MFQLRLSCLPVILALCGCMSSQRLTFNNTEMCFVEPVPSKFEICRTYSIDNIKEVNPEISLFAITITNQSVPVLYENSVTDLGDIRGFIMKYNGLREIRPGAFGNLREFIIGLAYNDLEEIEEGIFTNLAGIEKLYLMNNKISRIHQNAFNNMTDLTFICLNYNKLKHWDPHWLLGSSVTSIAATNNEIGELPAKAFNHVRQSPKQIDRIIGINFSNNQLVRLDKQITDEATRIQNFIVYSNAIQSIDEEFCENIEMLYMDTLQGVLNCNVTVFADSACKEDKTMPIQMCLVRTYAN